LPEIDIVLQIFSTFEARGGFKAANLPCLNASCPRRLRGLPENRTAHLRLGGMIGDTLGQYRIESEAGIGGMGVVYRAVDTALRRTVAIKVLPAGVGDDPERRRRFIQEAQAASALNHPGIVTIYQIGREGTTDYIAMEFVAGQSLAELLRRGPLPLKRALRVALDVADALAAAHKAGIIHRDLKPANVMVTDAGTAKLLDFGVAKLIEPAVLGAGTVTFAAATVPGLIVGTPAYMSPEQSEGQPVDARSDIYALGLVLYELITGRRLQGDFDPASLTTTPRALRVLIDRCLRRQACERFQVMDDVRHALEDVDLTAAAAAPAARSSRWMPAFAIVGAAALVAAVVLVWRTRAPPPNAPLVLTRVTSDGGLTTDPALSADGRMLAFASDRGGNGSLDIWVQQTNGGALVRLTDDPADDREPTFSPDGTKIAFESDRDGGGIYVMPTLSGAARRVADQCHRPRWSPTSNQILCWVGENSGFLVHNWRVLLVDAQPEEPRRLFADFAIAGAPVWSADGTHILFVGMRTEKAEEKPEWWIAGVDGSSPQRTGIVKLLWDTHLEPSGNPIFLPDAWTASGDVLFTAGVPNGNSQVIANDTANLWRIAVGVDGRAHGGPQRVTTGATLDRHPSASADGAIAFAAARENVDLWSLPIDASTGKRTGPPRQVTNDPAFDAVPTLTPDDSRAIFLSNRSGSFDLWMQEGDRQTVLVDGVSFPGTPALSRDGSMAIYGTGKPRRFFAVQTRAAPRTASRRLVCDDCVAWDVTSDNRTALFEAKGAIQARDIATGRTTQVTAAQGVRIGRLHLSPNDRWLVFNYWLGDTIRLIVIPFASGRLVSHDQWIAVTPENTSSYHGAWSPDGRLLYFLSERDGSVCVWAQPIDPQTGRPAGDAFNVWHLHETRRSMAGVQLGIRSIGLSRGRLMVTLNDNAGNVWLAK
jgi:Tol biopolymer transport system component